MSSPIHRACGRAGLVALLATLAGACAHAPMQAHAPRELPLTPPTVALRNIRMAADGLDSAVQVNPLRDAAIRGFIDAARQAEATHDYAKAAAQIDRALALAPEAPDLLQDRAEMDVALGHWQEAERRAKRSEELGPKVGALCARNWQTILEARSAADDVAAVEAAKAKVKACRVKPRLRL